MKVTIFLIFATFCCAQIYATSEDCLWGRKDPKECCKEVPANDPVHLANPKNCQSFYLCKNGEPLIWPCLKNQRWDVPAQRCIEVTNPTICAQRGPKPSPRALSENCKWGRAPPEVCCQGVPDGEPTHIANRDDCTTFWICNNSWPILFPCLPGQVWDVETQKCTPSSDVNTCPQKVNNKA